MKLTILMDEVLIIICRIRNEYSRDVPRPRENGILSSDGCGYLT